MIASTSTDLEESMRDDLRKLCEEQGFAAEISTSKFLRFKEDETEGEILDFVCSYLRKKDVNDVLCCGLAHAVAKSLSNDETTLATCLVEQEDNKRLLDGSKIFNASMKLLREISEKWITNLPQLDSSRQDLFVSIDSIKNKRRKMEDRHIQLPHLNAFLGLPETTEPHSYFAVYDGHGGVDAANYAANQLHINLRRSSHFHNDMIAALKEAYRATDEAFVTKAKDEGLRSGSTAVSVLMTERKMYVAWLGDSQVVLCKGGQCCQLMIGHKPDREDERKRIDNLGGCVVWFGGWRVNGCLSVSRAIGDYEQKPFISSEPDVAEFKLEGDEEFLIMACDGLWDVVSEAESISLLKTRLQEGIDKADVAKYLVDEAKSRGSMDNITIIVVFFNNLINNDNPTQVESSHLITDQNPTEEKKLENSVTMDSDTPEKTIAADAT